MSIKNFSPNQIFDKIFLKNIGEASDELDTAALSIGNTFKSVQKICPRACKESEFSSENVTIGRGIQAEDLINTHKSQTQLSRWNRTAHRRVLSFSV